MNELIIQRINEQSTKLTNEWMNEWMNDEWMMNEWMGKRMIE